MDLTLTRQTPEADGAFGELTSVKGVVAYTLEHAYDDGLGRGSFAPKVPAGVYTCQRSMHRLHGMKQDFETFEVLGVPGHTGILFHWGNFNEDSDGCILLGEAIAVNGQGRMITNSRVEFQNFMALQAGLDSFTLTILD